MTDVQPFVNVRSLTGSRIEQLAGLIDDACDTLGVAVMSGDEQISALGVAALLVLDDWDTLPLQTKWVSLVEPGDVTDGKVVLHTRSEIGRRRGRAVELTLGSPRVTDDLLNAVWVDEETRRYADPYEELAVVEHLWPTRW